MSYGRIAGIAYGGLIGLALCCTGCDTRTPVSTNERGRALAKAYSYIQNPANPYNFCGELHNEAMDSMAAWTPVGVVYDAQQTDSLMCHFMIQKGWGFIKSNGDTVRYTDEAADTLRSWLIENGTDEVLAGDSSLTWAYQRANLTAQQRACIDSILLAVENVAYPADGIVYSSVMNTLNGIEINILSSPSMTTEQKVLPLSVVALAKHSLEYWAHNTPPRLHSLAMGFGKATATAGIRKIVEADVLGATVGGAFGIFAGLIGGAVAGSILPGPGTAIGAAGGAVTGLIGGVITGGGSASVAAAASGSGGGKRKK